MENEFKILFLECLAYKIKFSFVKNIKLALISIEKVIYISGHTDKKSHLTYKRK